ncbi:MAG: hypothetical protein HZA89_04965 [Verrucomicrobia bacterium]|nr:hypothetical protein [Verrucomicrobiota bacterium]
MNLEHIRERLANGFKPFFIELSSGKKVPVPHPDFIAVSKNTVVVMDEDDHATRIDALHITALEDMKPSNRRK